MSKHFNNIELKHLAECDYSLTDIIQKFKHIAECQNCRTNLKKIAPAFFEESAEPPARVPLVSNESHFSDVEIEAFLKGDALVKHRLKMSEHFRNCRLCKHKLYDADPSYLKNSIAAYLDEKEENHPPLAGFSIFVPIFMAALVLASVVGFVISSIDNRASLLQAKITQEDEVKFQDNPEEFINQKPVNRNSAQNQASLNSHELQTEIAADDSAKVSLKSTSSSKGTLAINRRSPATAKSHASKAASKENTRLIVSETRSSKGSKCTKEATELALSPYFETTTQRQPTFRWKSVPNALKYNFYLSDTAQILIEDFESVSETTYSPKSKLESNKTYKWKVIATLKDGVIQQSSSVLFSIGEKVKQHKSAHRGKNPNGGLCPEK